MKTQSYLEEIVAIPLGAVVLEGVLAYPEEDAPLLGVLLLSPHPHMGGRMDNNVIEHLARRFAEAGCATLRFNYGGVGGSPLDLPEGDTPYEYWGRLETTRNYRAVLPDTLAARDFLVQALAPGTPIVYVGYSFGSCMSVLLAGEAAPERLVAISPPVSRVDMVGLDRLTMPVCFVTGDKDFVFDAARFEVAFEQVPGWKVHVPLTGSDHFFRKEEARVYEAIAAFVLDGTDGACKA